MQEAAEVQPQDEPAGEWWDELLQSCEALSDDSDEDSVGVGKFFTFVPLEARPSPSSLARP